MSTLKEFIDNLPATADADCKPTLVRLYTQIEEMKETDAVFLNHFKNKLQKRLADVREIEEKKVSDWIEQMKNGAALKVQSKDLTETEKATINEVMETYLLKELEKYQDKCAANKGNKGSSFNKIASDAFNTHKSNKESDECKFLEILKSFKNLYELFRVDYAKSFEKRIDDLGERIWELEGYLGIEHGADPDTSDLINPPGPPTFNATAATVAKKRKLSKGN